VPPTFVHLNGSINLPDTETVFRELGERIGHLAPRWSDGETGDRGNWIFFQLQRFWATPGLEQAGIVEREHATGAYHHAPKVRLADGADADAIAWPNLGYADAYLASWETFRRLRDEGAIPAGTRFQVQYPTPLASINAWIVDEDQDALEPSYERALFADLARLLDALPHDEIAVQWDVAVEFGILEGGFGGSATQDFDALVRRLVTAVEQVPADVPVGVHLCYGDYEHSHFREPESLATQVRFLNALAAGASRPVDFVAFTVPQYQRDPSYFAPLADLRVPASTALAFALVPYHPDRQEAGTTEAQVALIDEQLAGREWGVCTECGMGRVDRDDVLGLLDLHRSVVARSSAEAVA
jgi:hypothetical protein